MYVVGRSVAALASGYYLYYRHYNVGCSWLPGAGSFRRAGRAKVRVLLSAPFFFFYPGSCQLRALIGKIFPRGKIEID